MWGVQLSHISHTDAFLTCVFLTHSHRRGWQGHLRTLLLFLLFLSLSHTHTLTHTDVVGEDTISHWYKKGSHPKGRNVFLKDMEPFIKWLEEAEEEEDEEEE